MGIHTENKVGTEEIKYNADGSIGCCGWILWLFSVLLIFCSLPFSLLVILNNAAEYERVVVLRLGRLTDGAVRGPGIFFTIPCMDETKKIDIRTNVINIPPQEILTRDSVTVSVNAIVYFHISDPIKAVCKIQDAFNATNLLSATTLKTVLGTKHLSELLSEREEIAVLMKENMDEFTNSWGIFVERVEIKDIRLPKQLQRAMAAEAEATREAKAKVVAAKGEQGASIALREAANIMSESTGALQLRYLQTLNMIAAEKKSTMLFPVPIDMMSTFSDKNKIY